MTDLCVEVVDIQPERHAAAPHLTVRLHLQERSGVVVHAMALRCQVRIEPKRRTYDAREQAGLTDLFGTPDRYASTLSPFLWAHTSTMVQGFTGQTDVDLPVPCSYDFEVAGTKYLHALGDGSVPLLLLFSGTVFTRGEPGFSVEQLSWSLEARYDLPVSVWRETMDAHFPGSGWIRLDRDTIAALATFRSARGLTSWDETFAHLLEAEAPS